MASAETFHERLEVLRAAYVARLPGRVAECQALWAAWREGSEASDAFPTLCRTIHALGGAGETFQLPAVGEVARALDAVLQVVHDRGAGATDPEAREIERLLEALGAAARTALPAVARAPSPRGEPENRLIYLADGDAQAGSDLAGQIAHYGYDVLVLDGLATLREALIRSAPAALVVDGALLEQDPAGAGALADLARGTSAPAPCLVIATRYDFEAHLRAVRAGGKAYLTRPVDVAVLVDRLDSLTARSTPEPYRVLVVDDEADLAAHHAATLEGAGITTAVVTDPMQVMPALIDFRPDLMLIDMYMPVCSGLELAAVIRQQEAYVGIPIVFLSLETQFDRQLAALRHGGDDFLTRPILPEHLIAAVLSRARRARSLCTFMVSDSLTGLLNHTTVKERLELEVARSRRVKASLAHAMLDIDVFKRVNDTYGHATGDRVLKSLARLLQQRLRRTDVIGRYGGEEFALILPYTDASAAAKVVDEIRAGFGLLRHQSATTEFQVTLSAGVAGFPEHGDAARLAEAADAALYEAKRTGRNRVVRAAG